MEPRDDHTRREHRSPISAVPDEAPDPVETRDPRVRPVPARRGRAWLYAIPAAVLLLMGIAWMAQVELSRPDGNAPLEVTGTSGERANDPEGVARDDAPLNPVAEGPQVISDMALLTSKKEYVGRAVEIAAIPVMTVPGPRTFWVGRIANRTLVLLDRGVLAQVKLSPGQVVRLSGTLEAPPPADQLAGAGLSEDDREAIDGEDVIIRATRVEWQEAVGANQSPTPRR
jgi:hypothetical protein